jgi:hypothetical protein
MSSEFAAMLESMLKAATKIGVVFTSSPAAQVSLGILAETQSFKNLGYHVV